MLSSPSRRSAPFGTTSRIDLISSLHSSGGSGGILGSLTRGTLFPRRTRRGKFLRALSEPEPGRLRFRDARESAQRTPVVAGPDRDRCLAARGGLRRRRRRGTDLGAGGD